MGDCVGGDALASEVDIRQPVERDAPPWSLKEWLTYLRWAATEPNGAEPDTVETRPFAG